MRSFTWTESIQQKRIDSNRLGKVWRSWLAESGPLFFPAWSLQAGKPLLHQNRVSHKELFSRAFADFIAQVQNLITLPYFETQRKHLILNSFPIPNLAAIFNWQPLSGLRNTPHVLFTITLLFHHFDRLIDSRRSLFNKHPAEKGYTRCIIITDDAQSFLYELNSLSSVC